ncbi:hypothetical protein [Streptomyces sp. NPDC002537]
MTAVACAAALVGISACGNDGGGDKPQHDATPAPAASSAKPAKGGLDGLSAQEISRKAQSALGAAKSLHLKQDNNETDKSIQMDLFSDTKGNCDAKVSNKDEGTNTIVKRDNKVWMKPDSTMMEKKYGASKAPAAQGVLKDRYITGSDNDPMLAKPSKVCQLLPTMETKILADDTSKDKLTKDAPTTVEGVPVVTLKGTTAQGSQMTMYVASEGTPYPMKIVDVKDGRTTTSLLSDYDKPVPATTPSAAESIDAVEFRAQVKAAEHA